MAVGAFEDCLRCFSIAVLRYILLHLILSISAGFLYAFRSFICLEESNILGKIQLYFSCVLASPILLLSNIISDLHCCYHIRNMIMVCLGSLLCAIDLYFVCRPIPECFYYFGFIVYFII